MVRSGKELDSQGPTLIEQQTLEAGLPRPLLLPPPPKATVSCQRPALAS